MLYCIALLCVVLCCIVLHCIVLYCITKKQFLRACLPETKNKRVDLEGAQPNNIINNATISSAGTDATDAFRSVPEPDQGSSRRGFCPRAGRVNRITSLTAHAPWRLREGAGLAHYEEWRVESKQERPTLPRSSNQTVCTVVIRRSEWSVQFMLDSQSVWEARSH